MICGAAAWTAVASAHPVALIAGLPFAVAGSTAPDADLWLPRWLTGGHRHATHSLTAVLVLGGSLFAVSAVLRVPWVLSDAFLTGYMSHLVTDCMTVRGCPLLWPSSQRFWVLPESFRVSTGGKRRARPKSWQRSRGLPFGEWVVRGCAVLGSAGVMVLTEVMPRVR
jgi:hypothetical protein